MTWSDEADRLPISPAPKSLTLASLEPTTSTVLGRRTRQFAPPPPFAKVGEALTAPSDGPPPKSTVKDYFDCLTAQEVLRRKWDVFFKSFDVVIAPCYSVAAFPHFSEPDPWPCLKRTLRINGSDVAFAPQSAWPLIAGLPHLPATAAPIGRTRGGLPIGAQFIGPFLEDLTTIAFAGQISAEFGMTAEAAAADDR